MGHTITGTAVTSGTPAVSQLTYQSLWEEIGIYLKNSLTPTGADLTEVKRITNQGYLAFLSDHSWSFMYPETSIVLWTDIAVAAATTVSAAGTTVTASAASFYPSMIGASIVITDIGTFTITAYASSTVVTVSSSATCTSKTFSIDADGTYILPADFATLASVFAFAPTSNYTRLIQVSPDDIRVMQAGSATTGTPAYFAVQPRTFAYATGQRHELIVYPTPSSDTTMYYQYRIAALELTNNSDYPLGGSMHGMAIRQSCLRLAEQRKGIVDGVHNRLYFQTYLPAAIRRDNETRPGNLGYNRDESDGLHLVEHDRTVDVTYT